jgi:hypothetical protein
MHNECSIYKECCHAKPIITLEATMNATAMAYDWLHNVAA